MVSMLSSFWVIISVKDGGKRAIWRKDRRPEVCCLRLWITEATVWLSIINNVIRNRWVWPWLTWIIMAWHKLTPVHEMIGMLSSLWVIISVKDGGKKEQYDAKICGLRCVVSGYEFTEATVWPWSSLTDMVQDNVTTLHEMILKIICRHFKWSPVLKIEGKKQCDVKIKAFGVLLWSCIELYLKTKTAALV